jgi:hypothetical protein
MVKKAKDKAKTVDFWRAHLDRAAILQKEKKPYDAIALLADAFDRLAEDFVSDASQSIKKKKRFLAHAESKDLEILDSALTKHMKKAGISQNDFKKSLNKHVAGNNPKNPASRAVKEYFGQEFADKANALYDQTKKEEKYPSEIYKRFKIYFSLSPFGERQALQDKNIDAYLQDRENKKAPIDMEKEQKIQEAIESVMSPSGHVEYVAHSGKITAAIFSPPDRLS